ncbi:flagellar hook-associated protein 2 [Bacillus sp. SLBN-46]|uniref:flagellar filament capping protein FliD n=1 Tax=Bacillus sp. SLBN-46 TaxID=3042283 RepID=UPI0028579C64|nr:flagellar filament capping protein FliD [Bacillus sp. SLBN-46]MDR6123773.1 flagellar hook-associated protein 2 [Bacillus sp. SLBN-46]
MIDTSNTLRVSGLASGMNTDEIVANLVKVQSARLNKMQQSKTLATWKTDAYRDVNKKVNDFYNSMKDLRLESTFNKKTSSSSDESIVSATVSGIPSLSSYEITNVQQAQPPKAATVKFFQTSSLDTSKKLIDLGVTGSSIKINDQTVDFDPTKDTLSSLLNKISSDTTINMNVSYSASEKSFTFTNKTAGSGQDVKLAQGSTSNLLSILGIPGGSISGGSYNTSSTMSVVTGSNAVQAKMTINGLDFRSDTNTVTFDGMTFEIKSNMAADESLSVNTKSDTDAVFTSIKTFVDKYNELISDLNGKLTEKKYRDYPPLLDDQKKDMKDTDIKLWDEKAKSGLLAGDSTIQSFLTEMRNSLMSVVGDPSASPDFKTLKSIGINFSSSYKDNGKLVLDEEKLKGVLKTNLEDVKKLFTTKDRNAAISKTTANDKDLHDISGFGWRIYDRLNETITQLGSIAGSLTSTVDTKSFMAKQTKSLDTNIYNEQDKVNAYEQRLWKQFGAMEKAMQQLNSQGSWLSQQLGM